MKRKEEQDVAGVDLWEGGGGVGGLLDASLR